ncbi:MAG: Histidine kinase [Atribacteria bacterium 34_128]|nr:MAG: Histidine kinase [Atribacteria bacterium 34_128]
MKTITDHLFDILENSVNAKANKIIVKLSYYNKIFSAQIIDNGVGINLVNITDPFVTSKKTRKVGLGLPLLKSTVEATGGYLKITQLKEKTGTCVEFEINMNHIDAKPFGDIASVFTDAILSWSDVDLEVIIVTPKKEKKILDTVKIKKELKIDNLSNMELLSYLREDMERELKEIGIDRQFGTL